MRRKDEVYAELDPIKIDRHDWFVWPWMSERTYNQLKQDRRNIDRLMEVVYGYKPRPWGPEPRKIEWSIRG